MEIPKIETKIEIKNETTESADLYLYGYIRKAYPWEGSNETTKFISASSVIETLSGLKGKNLNVHINSGGGDVFESIAIGSLLKQHDADVTIIVDGYAGSGASVMAMSGKVIKLFSNAMLMIHKASTWGGGNSDDFRKMAVDLDKIDVSVRASYKNRFVGTEDELKDLIAEASWLTADECLAFGFCDEIIEEKKEPENSTSAKVSLFEKYKVINSLPEDEPKNILNKFKGGK